MLYALWRICYVAMEKHGALVSGGFPVVVFKPVDRIVSVVYAGRQF